MESFEKEAKKKKHGKYYCQIMNILVILPCSPTNTQMDDEESKGNEDEVEMGDVAIILGMFKFYNRL